MRHTVVALVASVALVLAAAAAHAQYVMGAIADVPFSFVVRGQTLPAGKYELVETSPALLNLRAVSGKAAGLEIPVLTRLGAAPAGADPKLVFDKVGDTNYLSEVWFADVDGYLLLATKGPHTHQTVKGSKK